MTCLNEVVRMSARDGYVLVDQVSSMCRVVADGVGVDERDDCEERCMRGG